MADVMKDINTARSSYYSFLSRLFERELTEEMLENLRVLSNQEPEDSSDMSLGIKELKEFFAEDVKNAKDELAAEYAKVFLAAGKAKGKAAFPYESVYTSREHLMMQDAWESMVVLFKSKGLKIDSTMEIKEDHIASELKYMSILCVSASTEEQKAFLDQHILNWIDRFCADIEELADYKLYKGIARITLGFIKEDREFLNKPV